MAKTIFVHGIFGWGESDPLWKVLPNWGMATGDLMVFLRNKGYDTAAASVGPISSAWDRACELYAQLTGTTTDYGAAHAARYGHKRFGRAYQMPMAPDWSEEDPIDLIGHSFGGTTIRLLTHLLMYGAPEEMTASAADVSPLFTGGKGSWVRTVVCIATPHNGSTLFDAWPDYTKLIEWGGLAASKVTGISDLKGLYDFKLEQFDFVKEENERLSDAIRRIASFKMPKNDWAADELGVDNAFRVNQKIRMVPGVRYVSLPGRRTTVTKKKEVRPMIVMTAPLQPSSIAMGHYVREVTPGGIEISEKWGPNDGLVNTVSARCPMNDPSVNCPFGGEIRMDVWNVLPTVVLDHLEMQGGANPLLRSKIRRLYLELMEMIR